MKEKKKIDRLYQEKFKDFEATPREAVWKNIAERLEEKQRRSLIPLWYKLSGVAAALALILGLTYMLNNRISTVPRVVFEIDNSELPKIEKPQFDASFAETSTILDQLINSTEHTGNTSQDVLSDRNNTHAVASEETDPGKKNTSNNRPDSPKNSGIANIDKKPNENHPDVHQDLNDTTIAIAETKINDSPITADTIQNKETTSEENDGLALLQNDQNEDEAPEDAITTESRNKKLSINPFAGPVYYDNLSSGSSLDPQFSNNSSSGQITMSFGINIAYAISDKIKIRSGIGKVAMSHNTAGVAYNAALEPVAMQHINYRENAENLNIRSSSPNSNSDYSSSPMAESFNAYSTGDIKQNFGFIEIPLELEYNILDKKFGINLIAGGSTLFLDENTISLNTENTNTTLGEANNLNNLSYSTNIGLGLNYNLSDNLRINMEPIFKYQINTFNNTSDVQPYYFGLYTGLNFSF